MQLTDSDYAFLNGPDGIEGPDFSHDPNDTKYGTEQAEYDQFRIEKGLPKQSVEFITYEEAREFLTEHYWNKYGCDKLPAVSDFVFFQFVLNLPMVAINSAQIVTGYQPTGYMDPNLIMDICAMDPNEFGYKLLTLQKWHYSVRDKKVLGLLNRVARVAERYGLSLPA